MHLWLLWKTDADLDVVHIWNGIGESGCQVVTIAWRASVKGCSCAEQVPFVRGLSTCRHLLRRSTLWKLEERISPLRVHACVGVPLRTMGKARYGMRNKCHWLCMSMHACEFIPQCHRAAWRQHSWQFSPSTMWVLRTEFTSACLDWRTVIHGVVLLVSRNQDFKMSHLHKVHGSPFTVCVSQEKFLSFLLFF